MTTYSKLIELKRNNDGDVTDVQEQVLSHAAPQTSDKLYRPFQFTEATVGDHKVRLSLKEAFLSQPDAGNLLRSDLRYIAFSTYNEMPRSFDAFTDMTTSTMPQEEYLRDAAIGVLPQTPSGSEAPLVASNFEGGVVIKNYRYAARLAVLGDWIRFDQLGKVRQLATEMGRAGRMTEEDAVYKFITTSANYTRNSTTNDNDVGANTEALTFNADGLDKAVAVIATAKDRKSGAYLGYAPDTIIAGPRMETFLKQFLMSGDLMRQHGNTTAETRGMGTMNPYQGLLSRIVISPWFGNSWGWALADSRVMGLKYQTVEPFNVYQQTQTADNADWLKFDRIEYLVAGYFGVGFVDDRAWFLSTSVTEPTVA